MYRLRLKGGPDVVARVSSYSSFVHLRQDHERIGECGHAAPAPGGLERHSRARIHARPGAVRCPLRPSAPSHQGNEAVLPSRQARSFRWAAAERHPPCTVLPRARKETAVRFGMLHLFENPLGRSEHEIIHEQLGLMRAAEDLGFDSVWPAEHHFTEYGYCASPALSLAAIARETKRIRLGTGVVVLPLNHPLRVADDYAFLDHVSDGRIDLGLGRGYQPLEFQR